MIIDTAHFSVGLGALNGLGQLLACVDPQKWASLGRPAAADIATLIFSIHADLTQATATPPEAGPVSPGFPFHG